MPTDTKQSTTCPQCRTDDSIDLSDGLRLCLACRNEWRPADVTIPPAAVVTDARNAFLRHSIVGAVLASETVDDVLLSAHQHFGVAIIDTDDDDTDDDVPADWSDNFVRLLDGRVALILEDENGDQMIGQLSDGTTLSVWREHATLIGVEPVGPTAETLADTVIPQAILATAGLCLTVALDCFEATDSLDDDSHLVGTPRTGWLPPPCDQVPEAEAGVAWAAALLIDVFGLDREQVSRLAANLLAGAEDAPESETT